MVTTTPRLCLVLDQPDLGANLRLASAVGEHVDMLKINDDAIDEAGMEGVVAPFRDNFPHELFLDTKMFKGTRTMLARALLAARLGVAYINAFALADRLLKGVVDGLEGQGIKLLGLTVLTHFNDAYCREYFGRSFEDTVRFLGEKAVQHGCHGLILPAPMLSAVSHLDVEKFDPGIRPSWFKQKANDQETTSTPREAVLQGSNVLIVGSPIALSNDPKEAARRIREEMLEAWEEKLRAA